MEKRGRLKTDFSVNNLELTIKRYQGHSLAPLHCHMVYIRKLMGLIPVVLSMLTIIVLSSESPKFIYACFMFPHFLVAESGIFHIPLIIALYYARKKDGCNLYLLYLLRSHICFIKSFIFDSITNFIV